MPLLRVGLGYDPGLLGRPGDFKQAAPLDVLVFPELVDGGYAALEQGAAAHRTNDTLLQQFQHASQPFSRSCIAGSTFFQHSSGRKTNASLVFSRGRLIHHYDKIHLFRPTGDTRYFTPGRSVGVFNLPLRSSRIRAGVVICYDLRFPELIRAMALKGMQVLFVPARWPRVRDEAWQTLLKARAVENQIFVVGCDAKGREGGYSYAFDPMGRKVFSNRKSPGRRLDVVSLDLATLTAAKKLHRNIDDAVLLRNSRIPLKF